MKKKREQPIEEELDDLDIDLPLPSDTLPAEGQVIPPDEDGLWDFGIGEGESPMERNSVLLQGLTNFNPFIRNQINDYLGLMWNEKKRQYTRNKLVKPIMNTQGALWLVGNLKIFTRDNNMLTYLREREFINLQDDVIDVLWYGFAPRARKEFGMSSTGDILRVCSELQAATTLVLSGAGEGKVMEFLQGSTSHSYNSGEGGQVPQGFGVPGVSSHNKGVFEKIKNIFT